MNGKSQSDRIIFGLKIKQLRQEQKMSFANLSEQTGLSVSYLNEIEKGKKFPKEDKIHTLSKAFGVSYEHLISPELNKGLAPVAELLQSNFLNELPLDLFGIDLAKIIEIIANAPIRVSAFISTLLELSRNYALKEENFYFGALRAFLELHNNYFEEIENQVERFCKLYDVPNTRPIDIDLLKNLLESRFNYEIVEDGLSNYPELQDLRSVYLPKKKQLLLNNSLIDLQKSFQLGKELGFQFLGLKERAKTSSILKSLVFEEVLNHSKAIYFSVALHIPKEEILSDLKKLFNKTKWDGDAFVSIMHKYKVTPEMFYHRLTNLLPEYFDMKKLFFLRFSHTLPLDIFEVDKELHLNHRHRPHSTGLEEHYCRRWISISLLQELKKHPEEDLLVGIQRSKYYGTDDEYLCLTLARPSYPKPEQNVSVTLGLLINDEVKDKFNFLEDPSIPLREVNNTCERCPVENCTERAAAPRVIQKKEELNKIQKRLEELSN